LQTNCHLSSLLNDPNRSESSFSILHFVQLDPLDKVEDQISGEALRLMWKIFLELRSDDLVTVGKQT
jgi:hypothetical protein